MRISIALCAALLASSLAWADATCPSDYASVAPSPSELVKLCPAEKVFAEPAEAEKTGNPLYCSYTFGHQPQMPSIPLGRFRVGSSQGTKISEAMKRTDPKAAADSDARGIGSGSEIKTSVSKMSWKGVDAYRIDRVVGGMNQTGDVIYVKSSKGVVTIQLKAGNKTPDCIEQVALHVAHH